MNNNSSNIVVYGWAFTPPTRWHHAIVKALLENMNISKLLIVPSGPRADKEYAIEKETRRRIIEIFASEFADTRIEADFTFFDSPTQTTTLGMDNYYREKIWVSPFQVFGADVTSSMEKWPNTPNDREYLLREMPKVFLSRAGVPMNLEWKWNYQLIDATIPEASSTAVREEGRLDLLTDRVREAYQKLVLDQAI